MAITAVKYLNFDSADLSATSNTSEVSDIRDIRNLVCVLNLTGAPTGTLNVIHYYGFPRHLASGGKDWSSNEFVIAQSFSPAGAPVKYVHVISSTNGMPCSAYQIVYTKASGTGSIKALQQNKGSGST